MTFTAPFIELTDAQQSPAPTCIICGNRASFLVNAAHRVYTLAPEEAGKLGNLNSVICGRCGSHNSVILDYPETDAAGW